MSKNIFTVNKAIDFLYDTEQLDSIHVIFCNMNGATGLSKDLNTLRVDYPNAFKVAKDFMLSENTKLGDIKVDVIDGIQFAFLMAQSSLFEQDFESRPHFLNSIMDDTLTVISDFLDSLDAKSENVYIVSTTPLAYQGLGIDIVKELYLMGRYYEAAKINWRILK